MTSKETIIEHIENGVGIDNGTVLRCTEKPKYDEPREVAAMFYDGYWYTTRQGAMRLSHAYFIEYLQGNIISNVEIATKWEAVK